VSAARKLLTAVAALGIVAGSFAAVAPASASTPLPYTALMWYFNSGRLPMGAIENDMHALGSYIGQVSYAEERAAQQLRQDVAAAQKAPHVPNAVAEIDWRTYLAYEHRLAADAISGRWADFNIAFSHAYQQDLALRGILTAEGCATCS
jgi:hypothetical protein